MTLGEAILPLLGVMAIATFGWRQSWSVFGFCVTIIIPISILFLLKGYQPRHDIGTTINRPKHIASNACHHWTRREVLKDIKFYLFLPLILTPSFLYTGFFFHQVHIANLKNWPLSLIASSYIAFAICQMISAFIAGELVDKFGSLRLLKWYMLPFIFGVIILGWIESPLAIWFYMGFGGISAGASSTLSGAVWSELYGTRYLGAIRSLVISAMVLSSAASPILLGRFFDYGFTLKTIILLCLSYLISALIIVYFALRRHKIESIQNELA
jgi:MFS family permease